MRKVLSDRCLGEVTSRFSEKWTWDALFRAQKRVSMRRWGKEGTKCGLPSEKAWRDRGRSNLF